MDKRHREISIQRLGMRRRKKEVRHIRVMTALTVLLLSVTVLFQDNMNQYQMEMNYACYGEWLIREPLSGEGIDSPYLETCGEIWSGSTIYQALSEDTADIITVEPSNEERYTGRILGTMDSEIVKAGKIKLYEGKMPERDNEIAMELNVLQALGCNYDLGQQITFYIAENEDLVSLLQHEETMQLHRVSYTLVGTLHSYSTSWSGGDALPSAVITKEAFEQQTMPSQKYRFLQISEAYQDRDVSAFASSLIESMKQRVMQDSEGDDSIEDMGYASNDYAYDNPFWGNSVMYRNMTLILIVLSGSIMAYLMSSYLSGRRPQYYRLREIGATVGQIWRMAIYECIGSVVPVALGMLVCSYAASTFIVFGVASLVDIPFFYVFRWETLLCLLLCIGLVLAISMLCAFMSLRKKRVTEQRKTLPWLVRKILRRRIKRRTKRITIREIYKRRRICHLPSVLFARITGVVTCFVILVCLMQINEKRLNYQRICQEYQDFTVSVPRTSVSTQVERAPAKPYDIDGKEETEVALEGAVDQERMEDTIPDSMIQEIQELSGVQSVEYSTRDQTHIFDWTGKGDSPYYQFHIYWSSRIGWKTDDADNLIEIDTSTRRGKALMTEADQDLYEGRYYEDCSAVWKELNRHLDQKVADYDRFCAGKQVILLEDTEDSLEWMALNDEGREGGEEKLQQGYIEKDETLQAGDTLTIRTDGKDLEVEIAGVLSAEEMDYQYGDSAYNIVGSGSLGRSIAGEEGEPYGYNHMEIQFNALYNAEATDKIITRKCTSNNLEYESNSEWRRAGFQKVVQAAFLYGALAAVVFVLYLFVLSCMLQEEGRQQQPENLLLWRMGVSRRQMQRFRFCDSVRESLSVLYSAPVLYMVWLLRIRADWDESVIGYNSIFFHKTVYELTERKYLFYALMDSVNICWLAVFLTVMICVASLMRLLIGKNGEEG